MRKLLSKNKYRIPLILAAIFVMAPMGTGITNAWLKYAETGSPVTSSMATVDIELESRSYDNGTVDFTVGNKSNIDIYLRAGVIFELVSEDDGTTPVIADTSGITITAESDGWKAESKTVDRGGISYPKYFLRYAGEAVPEAVPVDYQRISYETKSVSGQFTISGDIPEGCKLVVNIVPEAVQAESGSGRKALDYLNTGDGQFTGGW